MWLKLIAPLACLAVSFPHVATAQDATVTLTVERVCIPFVSGKSWEDATWQQLEVSATAIGYAFVSEDDWGGTIYVADTPGGVYNLLILTTAGSSTCLVTPPANVPTARLERAVGLATDAGWPRDADGKWARNHHPSGSAMRYQTIRVRPSEDGPGLVVSVQSFTQG